MAHSLTTIGRHLDVPFRLQLVVELELTKYLVCSPYIGLMLYKWILIIFYSYINVCIFYT